MYISSKNKCIYKRLWWNWIYVFFVKDYELLEKYNEIWEKVRNSSKKDFDSELVYNEKYLKAKIKSYNG